jgi:DNA-binding transcriptional MerR regulator
MSHFLLGEAAEAVGVPGHRIAYAISNGTLPEPQLRINNHRIFSRKDIERMKTFFGERKEANG